MYRRYCGFHLSRPIRRTSNALPSRVQDVDVDHRRAYVPVAQQFLDRPDIVPVLQEMSSERMPKSMTGYVFLNARPLDGFFHGALENSFVHVVAEQMSRFRIRELSLCGEDPLPPPLPVRIGILSGERIREFNVPSTAFQIPSEFFPYFFRVLLHAGFGGAWKVSHD